MVVAAMGMAEGSGDSRAGETVAILDWRDRDGGRGQPASGAGARSSRAQRPSGEAAARAGGRAQPAGGAAAGAVLVSREGRGGYILCWKVGRRGEGSDARHDEGWLGRSACRKDLDAELAQQLHRRLGRRRWRRRAVRQEEERGRQRRRTVLWDARVAAVGAVGAELTLDHRDSLQRGVRSIVTLAVSRRCAGVCADGGGRRHTWRLLS